MEAPLWEQFNATGVRCTFKGLNPFLMEQLKRSSRAASFILKFRNDCPRTFEMLVSDEAQREPRYLGIVNGTSRPENMARI